MNNQNQNQTPMEGVVSRMFTLVSENMKLHEAIQELIDNSLDAQAKHVVIYLDNKKSTFICFDDGCGMNEEQMGEYARKYTSHMPTTEKTIGKFGAGSKDAIIKIADQNVGGDVAVTSWTDEEHVSRMYFKVDSRKEDDFRNPELNTTIDKKWVKNFGAHGHLVSIKHIKDAESNEKNWKNSLIKEVSNAYPYIINKYGVEIKINGKTVECIDRMHLDVLGNDIENNGIYIKNGYVFIVKTYTLTHVLDKTKLKSVKVIYLYIPNEIAKDDKDEKKYEFCGLYPILNGRYLTSPKIGNTGLPFQISYQGGTGRWRACIIVDGNEEILGLKSKKSDGIDITYNNTILSKYRLVNNDNVTFTNAFEYDFKRLNVLSEFQSHENPNDKYRKLSVDVVKRIFSGESGKTLFKEYDATQVKSKDEKESSSTTTAPISPSIEEEEEVKRQVDEGLEIVLDSQVEVEHLAVNVFKDKTTGFTTYNYTEYKPSFVDENLVNKVFNILVEEKLKKPQIARICSKVARLNEQ